MRTVRPLVQVERNRKATFHHADLGSKRVRRVKALPAAKQVKLFWLRDSQHLEHADALRKTVLLPVLPDVDRGKLSGDSRDLLVCQGGVAEILLSSLVVVVNANPLLVGPQLDQLLAELRQQRVVLLEEDEGNVLVRGVLHQVVDRSACHRVVHVQEADNPGVGRVFAATVQHEVKVIVESLAALHVIRQVPALLLLVL